MTESGARVPDQVRFVPVAEGDGPPEGGCLAVVVEGRGVAIFRSGGRLMAISDRCPHNGLPLHDGSLAAGVVTCRWHGWSFELATGRPPNANAEIEGVRVRTYPVRREGGRILVGLPADWLTEERKA